MEIQTLKELYLLQSLKFDVVILYRIISSTAIVVRYRSLDT